MSSREYIYMMRYLVSLVWTLVSVAHRATCSDAHNAIRSDTSFLSDCQYTVAHNANVTITKTSLDNVTFPVFLRQKPSLERVSATMVSIKMVVNDEALPGWDGYSFDAYGRVAADHPDVAEVPLNAPIIDMLLSYDASPAESKGQPNRTCVGRVINALHKATAAVMDVMEEDAINEADAAFLRTHFVTPLPWMQDLIWQC